MIIDTSSNNPEQLPGWCTGVIIKQTQGMTYVNPYVYSQINQAKTMGIPYATYHYLTSVSTQEIDRAISFFTTLDGPEFLMLDFSKLVNLNAIVAIPQPEGVKLVAYCDQTQEPQVSFSGLPIGLAVWGNQSNAEQYLASHPDLFGIQWTDNYQGYDAWITSPGYLSELASAPPPAEANPIVSVEQQVSTVEDTEVKLEQEIAQLQQEVQQVTYTDYTWSTGPNGEGWMKIPQTSQVVSVVALTSTDPSTGAPEVAYYPRFVVTPLNGYQLISWSGARPDSQIAFRVASI